MTARREREDERDEEPARHPSDHAVARGRAHPRGPAHPRRAALAALCALGLALGAGCGPAPRCPRWLRPEAPTLPAAPTAPIAWLPPSAPAYPALDARIAGFGAWLVLDTGANQHALERGAGFWLRLSRASASVGATDAIGLPVRLSAYGEVPVALGLRDAPPRLTLYGFAGEALLASGAAGVVSPQRLAPRGGAVHLDLRGGRVRVARAPPPASWGVPLQPTCPSADGVPLYVVDATVDGVPGFFVVDTGSDRSSVLREGRFRERFDGRRRPGRAVATLAITEEVDEVPDIAVRLAGFEGAVVLDLLDPAPGRCPSDGTLGGDVLRHCALWLGREGGRIACAPNVERAR